MTGDEPTEHIKLSGRYELGSFLGRGGMGIVRAATDLRLDRPVAIKILRPDLADQTRARRRFETEERAAARLAHPNVVTVFDSGEDAGAPFLVMERLPGRTLADEIAEGPLPLERAHQIGVEILSALDAAHRAGIVHRDIKPGNVLLTTDGHVKVSDFGIAKAMDDLNATQTTDRVATLSYVAPERLNGEPASVRSDLYSVGVLLYEVVAGRRPYSEATPVAEMRAIEHGYAEPLASIRPEVPDRFAEIIAQAMARDSTRRFASAAGMLAALDRVSAPAAPTSTDTMPAADTVRIDTHASADTELAVATLPVEPETAALSSPPIEAVAEPRARSRLGVGFVAAAVLILIIIAGAFVIHHNGGSAKPAPPVTTPTTTKLPAPLQNAIDHLEQDATQ